MNRHSRLAVVATFATAVLLCACDRTPAPATPATAAGPDAPAADAPVPAAPSAVPATPAATGDAAASAPVTADPASSTAPSPAASADGDAAVNAAIDAALGDHTRYQPVIASLQSAVAANDAAAVSRLARYPLSVTIDGKQVELRNEQEFAARYPQFMSAEIRDAIVQTRYSDLFVNYKGVMFGRGQAWINGICRDDACKEFDVKLVTLQPGP